MSFISPFFSIKGQIERIKNVGAVLNSAFNPLAQNKGVTANVSNPTLKKVLETTASHPYVTAGIVAGGITAVTHPVAAIKAIIPSSTKGKFAAAIIYPTVIGAIAKAPTKSLEIVTSTPSAFANVGGNVADLAQNPSISNVKKLFIENPVITSAAAAAAALIIAKAVIPAVVATRQTSATNEQTEAIKEATEGLGQTYSSQPTQIISNPQFTPQTPAVVAPEKVAPAGVKPKKKAKKKKKTTKKRKTRRSKKKRKSIKRRRK